MSKNVFLQTDGTKFVTKEGDPVRLHGIGLGGWLNMENFILGIPSTEALNRRALKDVIGADLTEYFFEKFMDAFFSDADAAAIAACGFNIVRIPVHYRHFEDDSNPFVLKESGFARLDSAIQACARHGLYTIIDLHVLPGSQNNEWHCDNPTHHAGFWGHPHFEDRVVNLWRELASRYRDNPWVAGYEPMNEPGDPEGHHINAFFPRLIAEIRDVDPDHILFLKGNAFGDEFGFYQQPLANVVFIAFDYAESGAAGGGEFPGETKGVYYDEAALEQRFLALTEQARQTGTPIWMGEFGPVYTGVESTDRNRYRVLDEQMRIYRRHGANWALWTWKDINVQGIVHLDPSSPYMTRIEPVLRKKARLATDAWGHVDDDIRDVMDPLTARFNLEFPAHPRADWTVNRLVRHILFAEPLVTEYAECFRGIDKAGIDEVMTSFELASCLRRTELIEAVRDEVAQIAEAAAGAEALAVSQP